MKSILKNTNKVQSHCHVAVRVKFPSLSLIFKTVVVRVKFPILLLIFNTENAEADKIGAVRYRTLPDSDVIKRESESISGRPLCSNAKKFEFQPLMILSSTLFMEPILKLLYLMCELENNPPSSAKSRPSLHQRWEGFKGERMNGDKPIFSVERASIIRLLCVSLTMVLYDNLGEEYQIEWCFSQRFYTIFNVIKESVVEIRHKIDPPLALCLGRTASLFALSLVLMWLLPRLCARFQSNQRNIVHILCRYQNTHERSSIIDCWGKILKIHKTLSTNDRSRQNSKDP
ncbi:Protein LURP-one-related 12, partial [Mucuna pruriens]